LNNYFTECNSL